MRTSRPTQVGYLFSAVAQTFLSAGSGDFPVPRSNIRDHRGTRKFREPAGWKACATGRGRAKQVPGRARPPGAPFFRSFASFACFAGKTFPCSIRKVTVRKTPLKSNFSQ